MRETEMEVLLCKT